MYMEYALDTTVRDVLKFMQNRIMGRTTYFGVKALKCPLDAWVYQEIIFETKPDVIVEIGNSSGGGTLALAHLCDLMERGRVIGIDITHEKVPAVVRSHPRITLIESDACAAFPQVQSLIPPQERALIIEDSAHTFDNTLNVLRTYQGLVKPGDYFIVEDSICHHGLDVGPMPGPYDAVEEFVRENGDFQVDRMRESFFITWNPKGYLKRVR
jgi:cephalosporin hydroxylase